MTSQLNVDTIVDKAGTSGPSLPNTTTIKIANTSTYVSDGGAVTQNTVQGLAKAWSHTDVSSGTPSVADSFNIASLTDNFTGNTTHTFTNGMNNDNYSVPSSCNAFYYSSIESYATTGYSHRIANTSATQSDRDNNVSAAFGDLA